ncbi:MAG: hypothetical protein M1827_000483 [Pycnora praestabilis]|nr:MAG: hypothetical protein M1827_000483 [Pycnora praestabilis]
MRQRKLHQEWYKQALADYEKELREYKDNCIKWEWDLVQTEYEHKEVEFPDDFRPEDTLNPKNYLQQFNSEVDDIDYDDGSDILKTVIEKWKIAKDRTLGFKRAVSEVAVLKTLRHRAMKSFEEGLLRDKDSYESLRSAMIDEQDEPEEEENEFLNQAISLVED